MKRVFFLLLSVGLLVSLPSGAEQSTSTTTTPSTTETAVAPKPSTAPMAAEAPVAAPAAVVPAPAATPGVATENGNTDNLEFISGEVGELDEAGKTVTVKLYGESESATTGKTLKVSVDASTDITDGEQDRDFKSLSVGTEVDVEYDPATNKATYIFVY